jgi:hypothetical protein
VGWIRSKGVNVSEQPNSGVVIGSHFGPMTRTRGRSREFMNCNMKGSRWTYVDAGGFKRMGSILLYTLDME